MTREEKKDAIYNLITDYCNDHYISDMMDVEMGVHVDLMEEIFKIIFEEE